MEKLTSLTVHETLDGLKNKSFSAVELTNEYLRAMEEKRALNAYVLETPEKALAQAEEADRRYRDGTARALEGIPLGIKDLFCTEGVRTTACSHILDGFVPPYESTVTGRLFAAGAGCLGKLNMDEFAMGGSNETSFYGPAYNPWQAEKAGAGRFFRRFGGSGGGQYLRGGNRNRYRRFDPPAGRFLRRHRHQADLRPLFPLRHYGLCFFA